jgi:hypothetical protein
LLRRKSEVLRCGRCLTLPSSGFAFGEPLMSNVRPQCWFGRAPSRAVRVMQTVLHQTTARSGQATRSREPCGHPPAVPSLSRSQRLTRAVRPLAASERNVGHRAYRFVSRAGLSCGSSAGIPLWLRPQRSNPSIERIRLRRTAHVKR